MAGKKLLRLKIRESKCEGDKEKDRKYVLCSTEPFYYATQKSFDESEEYGKDYSQVKLCYENEADLSKIINSKELEIEVDWDYTFEDENSENILVIKKFEIISYQPKKENNPNKPSKNDKKIKIILWIGGAIIFILFISFLIYLFRKRKKIKK
ncbi:MAG: hypothetical protein I3273_05815 [Candidatus Moeniiplasma glomeromycotorum]|nr:hypothetical protein [Candidatus Moeniiplasma glomeromycotorum]MCE8169602.1 hypothetical protein [Candidatus Moeniiplasma glomeromycotorum]